MLDLILDVSQKLQNYLYIVLILTIRLIMHFNNKF
jgi:hypothetical protein